ncbi:MAG: lysophospholipid acyltransferase family protein [Candidatus Omnitrophota bacterium]
MLSYILYRFAQFIALSLPIKLAYRVAIFFSDIHYLFADKDRARTYANLKAIFPEKPSQEIRRIRLGMFRNFAKYLVDFFRFSVVDEEFIKKNVTLVNINYLNQVLNNGKGGILLSAHLGNWELGGIAVPLLGYPTSAVALTHKHIKVNNFFVSQRENKGLKVIPLGKAVKQCLSAIASNQLIALVGDRDFSEKGMIVDFFNKPTIFPEGPAVFHLKTGAPIIPIFMLRNQDDSFTYKLEKPIEFTPTGDRNKDVKELISLYKLIFEDYIRKYPDQWYMFRQFWVK